MQPRPEQEASFACLQPDSAYPPSDCKRLDPPHGCINNAMKGKLCIALTYNTKEPWQIRKWKGSFGTRLGKSRSHCCLLLSLIPRQLRPEIISVFVWLELQAHGVFYVDEIRGMDNKQLLGMCSPQYFCHLQRLGKYFSLSSAAFKGEIPGLHQSDRKEVKAF